MVSLILGRVRGAYIRCAVTVLGMSNPELDVVEFLLTTAVYNGDRDLDEDDLPPAYRHVFWTDGRIERPLSATGQTAADATDD